MLDKSVVEAHVKKNMNSGHVLFAFSKDYTVFVLR